MPEDRKDWKAFNVFQKEGEDSCQLTVWLNEYVASEPQKTNKTRSEAKTIKC